MYVRLAALAAWLLLTAATTPVAAAELMTLDDAFARVAQTHPELRLVDARTSKGLRALGYNVRIGV